MNLRKLILATAITFLVVGNLIAGGKSEGNGTKENSAKIKVQTFKFGGLHPAEHPMTRGAEYFAKLVKERSGGQLKVDVYPSGQLGSERDLFDAVALGSVEFSAFGTGQPAKIVPELLVLDAPFLARDRDHLVRILKSDVMHELMDKMTQESPVEALGAFYYGTRHLTTGKVKVTKFSQLKNLKIRVPEFNVYVSMIRSWGAIPTPISFSDLYLALSQGVVDGQENPAGTIVSAKLYEVQKYLTKTGHTMGIIFFCASKKIMEKLSPEQQQIIRKAGAEASDWITKTTIAEEDGYMQKLADAGMEIIDIDRAPFEKAAQQVYKEYENTWGKGLLERLKAVP